MAVGRIEDARARLYAAESHLKESDYPGAMLEAQMCMELSIKALLDKLGVSYKTREGKIPHDVSDKIPEAFEKLKQYMQGLKEYEIKSIKVELARSAVLLRLLTSIREYLEYGVNGLAGSKEVFDFVFAGKLAATVVDQVRNSYWRIYDLINRLDKSAATA
jgi:hypothetical protein